MPAITTDPNISESELISVTNVATITNRQQQQQGAPITSLTNNSLLLDFLSLVEPIDNESSKPDPQEEDRSVSPCTVVSSTGSITIGDSHYGCDDGENGDHGTRLNSMSASTFRTPFNSNMDPRLCAIDPKQLQPLATLFTKFYKEQATSTKDVLPQYKHVVDSMDLSTDSRDTLSEVLSTIDRLAVMTNETMLDQRVTLTQNKQAEMAALVLAKNIQRLAVRLDGQRVEMQPSRKSELDALVSAIERSGQQMSNQRVVMDGALERRIALARMGAVLEKMNRLRLDDQDWKSPQYLLETEMSSLSKRMDRNEPSYDHQRFVLSGQKQRDMFVDEMMKRLRRMNDRRLDNQDAQASPRFLRQLQKSRKSRFSMSDFDLIERITQLTPKKYDTQRAVRRNSWVPFLSEKRSLEFDLPRPRLNSDKTHASRLRKSFINTANRLRAR